MRPPLALLGGTAPLALILWAGKSIFWEGLLVILAVFFGNLGWTMMNEYKDAKVDRVNKPYKPIPSGQVDKYNVLFLSCMFILFSLIANYYLLTYYGIIYGIGFLGHLGSFVYNCMRKDLVGNLYMSFAYGCAAFMSVYPRYILFPLGFFTLTFAFNLAVQYQDLKVEKTAGVITAPQQLGVYTSPVGILFSVLSYGIFWELYARTLYMPLWSFIAASVLSTVSCASLVLVNPGSKLQEILNRYLGRILLLIGFIWMIVTEVAV